MKLNLGSGQNKKEGFINIDSNPSTKPDVIRDVCRGLPYTDGVADEICAEHLIEHLNAQDFIFFFNECWRVLKSKGILHIKAPYYKEKWAVIDPTHVRLITEYSFDFFFNRDYNSMTAGVTGWYEPEKLQIIGGELQLTVKKVETPTQYWDVKEMKEVTK